MNRLTCALGVVVVCSLVGCGDSASGHDMGTGTDAGSGTDLGTGTDSGTHPDLGTGTDAGTGTDSGGGGDVAACQASVDAVRAACVTEDPTDNRLCIYDALRPLCASGRTAFVKAVFDCLMMDACQSPSDPSGAGTCVQTAIHTAATANDHALGMFVCGCDSSEPNCDINEPAYTLANLMMLNDSDIPGITSCVMGDGCPIGDSCISSTPLGTAFACP